MKVLICGANGFIGRALCAAFEREGHQVLKGLRRVSHVNDVAVDYTQDVEPEQWRERLEGVDMIINAVGILSEQREQTFDTIHHRAPCALFEAGRRAGVKRMVQISALGAQRADTGYFISKLAADTYLQTLPVDFLIVRPSLVYGMTGSSAGVFRALASAPVHFLPAGGHQLLRPIHVNDLVELVMRWVNGEIASHQTIDAVGGTEVEYRDMLSIYRASMMLPQALRVRIPKMLIQAGAALLDRVPGSMLTRDTWHMLQEGNTGDVGATRAALGRMPAGIETFIPQVDASLVRHAALAAWHSLCLRPVLAVTWLWTALVSAFIYPQAASLALLAKVHMHGVLASGVLYGAAALNFVFGVATLIWPSRRLWAAQAALIVAYSAIIAIALPEFLFHPFGPILKNLPILAILLILFSKEVRS